MSVVEILLIIDQFVRGTCNSGISVSHKCGHDGCDVITIRQEEFSSSISGVPTVLSDAFEA